MPALTKTVPRLLTGRNTRNGLAGILQRMLGGYGIKGAGIVGTVNIPSGQTTATITDAGVTANDLFIVVPMLKGANVSAGAGVSTITAGVSYVVNVTADPGAAGVTLLVIRIPAALVFSS